MNDNLNSRELPKEMAELRQRLAEAEETLRAIRSGEVDALVVNTKLGEQVFTPQGADTVYRVAIENINEGAITLSPEGTIPYSNRYFAQMIHADLNKVIGASIFDFIGEENRDPFTALLAQDNGRVEISLRAADGSQVPVYVAVRKLQLDIPTICAVVTDLTEQKRSQETISVLKQTGEVKDAFIGMVSHEIRTPLTVILGADDTALTEGLSQEDLQSLLRDAKTGAERLNQIVSNMIELSRSQSNMLSLNKEVIDTAEVVASVIAKEAVRSEGHNITRKIPKNLPRVNVDKTRF